MLCNCKERSESAMYLQIPLHATSMTPGNLPDIPKGQAIASQRHVRVCSDLADAEKVHIRGLVGQQEGEGVPGAAHPGSPAHPVHKDIRILGRVKLHNPGHIWDVQAPRCYICAQQHTCMPCL